MGQGKRQIVRKHWNQPYQHRNQQKIPTNGSPVITALNALLAAKMFEYVSPHISEIKWSILRFTFFFYVSLMNVLL